VETLVADLSSQITPERLRAYLRDNGWTFLHHNAIGTEQKWELRTADDIIRVFVPAPDAPPSLARTRCMRRAVEALLNAEGWPLVFSADVTLPEGLR
jgi:hypothetical protein